jgi:hypothetical protein
MYRILLLSLLVIIGSADAFAGRADALFADQLERATQARGSFQFNYDFTIQIDALGETAHQTMHLESGSRLGQPYIHIGKPETTRLNMGSRQLCHASGDAWDCTDLTQAQSIASRTNPHMRLYPPTAMHLLRELVTAKPTAMVVSRLEPRTVGVRQCDVYQVAIDPTTLDREQMNRALYLDIESDDTIPFISGLVAQLCFDRATGQVLAYRNVLTLDQAAMAEAGLLSDATAQRASTGLIIADLHAQ